MGTGQAAAGQGKPGPLAVLSLFVAPFGSQCLTPGFPTPLLLGGRQIPSPWMGRARENVAPSTFPRPFLSQEQAGSTAQADPCHGPAMANFPRG